MTNRRTVSVARGAGRRRLIALVVTVGAIAVTSQPAYAATFTVTPSTVVPGEQFTFRGDGCLGSRVEIRGFGPITSVIVDVTLVVDPDPARAWARSFALPADAFTRTYTLRATCVGRFDYPSLDLTVRSASSASASAPASTPTAAPVTGATPAAAVSPAGVSSPSPAVAPASTSGSRISSGRVERQTAIARRQAQHDADVVARNQERQTAIARRDSQHDADIVARNQERQTAIAKRQAQHDADVAARNDERETAIAKRQAERDADGAGDATRQLAASPRIEPLPVAATAAPPASAAPPSTTSTVPAAQVPATTGTALVFVYDSAVTAGQAVETLRSLSARVEVQQVGNSAIAYNNAPPATVRRSVEGCAAAGGPRAAVMSCLRQNGLLVADSSQLLQSVNAIQVGWP